LCALILAAAEFSVAGDPAALWVPLGSCSTPLGESSPERVRNITLAAGRIDGTIVPPGRRFSFNETVGPRTVEAGYGYAPTLLYGEKVSLLGGGICQLSGTLYNAVLLSDLRVRERHRHSTAVDYIPLGQDATVSWGMKDLVFENALSKPVLIQAAVEGTKVVVQVSGTEPLEFEVALETDVWEVPSPADENGEPGIEVTLYRVRSREGSVIEREYLHRDYFPPHIMMEREE
jgi:vancomycin resistance protein YoaR